MALFGYYLWALVVCPVIGALVAVRDADNPSISYFMIAFFVIPAALAAGGARLLHVGGTHTVVGSVGAFLLGGGAWLLLVLWAASSGWYDT